MNKVRKRGRIAKKAKSKISNTAEDPFDLVSEEKTKRVGSGNTRKTLDMKVVGESYKGKSRKEKYKKRTVGERSTMMSSKEKGKKVLDGSKKRKWKASEKGGHSKKMKKWNDWFGIRTRTSPYQFFRCISVLKEKQRAAVKQMGFGKLLRFKVDGIPAKLAHFVVDNFRPDKLEIRVPCGKIKIDSEVIQRLLGIPCGGVSFSSLTKLEAKNERVRKWKSRYAGRFCSPLKIVDNIEQSEDEDGFDFRMDFLMCFLTVMVDCQKQGRLRERILNYITEETNFGELDWCGYVVEKLRKCKDRWTRCDRGSSFVGPLTILTLLYVDNTECKGMEVDYTVDPITFWNMERLKVREKLEIRNGGFGMGTFKVDHLLEKRLEVEKLLDVTMKEKKKVENALGKLYQKYPENEEVSSLKARYESILEEKPRWPTKLTKEISIADDEIKSVLKGIHDGLEKEYDAETELGGKPTGEAALPGSNEMVTVANFILELNQFQKGNARWKTEAIGKITEAEDKVVHDEESDKCHGEGLENVGGSEMEIDQGDVSDKHGGQKVTREGRLEISGSKAGATSCVQASEYKKGPLGMVVYNEPGFCLGVSQIGIKVGEDKATHFQENGVVGEGAVEENQMSLHVESKDLRVDEDGGLTHEVQEGFSGYKRKRDEGKELNKPCVEPLEKVKNIIGGDEGINAANDMMDKVMTEMEGLSGLTLDERLIVMSVIGRSAPLSKMFDRLDVDGKFRMAQMVANGSIR